MKRGIGAFVIALVMTVSPVAAQDDGVLAPGFHRLQQVAITTADIDRSVAFYRDTVGVKLMFIDNNMAFFDLAGTRLVVALDRKRQRLERP